MATQKLEYTDFTWLPLKELVKTGSTEVDLVVITPHKGAVVITTKQHGFFVDKDTSSTKILSEIKTLQAEATRFLVNEWLEKVGGAVRF